MYQHSLAVHIPAKSTTIILLDCKEHNGKKQLTKEAFALKKCYVYESNVHVQWLTIFLSSLQKKPKNIHFIIRIKYFQHPEYINLMYNPSFS